MGVSSLFSKILNYFRSSTAEKKPQVYVEHTSQSHVIEEAEVKKTNLDARKLLKKATQLKKSKQYVEACEKLREAYKAPGSKDLMVKELLRLPMYLQLAGKNDDGWREINELNVKFVDVYSQAEIANQMRVFLQKEKQFQKAILFSVWAMAKEIERDKSNVENSIKSSDEMAKLHSEYEFLDDTSERQVYGKNPNGNPITDHAYEMFLTRVNELKTIDGISIRLEKDMKKAKLQSATSLLAEDLSTYFSSEEPYKLEIIRDIVQKRITVV
jgi:hypothetical protein